MSTRRHSHGALPRGGLRSFCPANPARLPFWHPTTPSRPLGQARNHAGRARGGGVWPASCTQHRVQQRPRSNPAYRSSVPDDDGRLNLLLSYGGWRKGDSWADRLPTLLEPFGVRSWRADSGAEAQQVLEHIPVHLAVIDLALPLERGPETGGVDNQPAGARLLQLMTRLPWRPPTLVVQRRLGQREGARDLASALHCGAFAVIERPVDLEAMLDAMRRVLVRCYADRWPQCPDPEAPPSDDGGGPTD